MKKNAIFFLSLLGVIAGLAASYYYGIERHAEPPLFKPTSSPYASAIFANGIVESSQNGGANINLYPEVAAAVVRVWVQEGQTVNVGDNLISLDDSVQRATTESLRLQAEAAQAVLASMQAQPRPESLEIAKAQLVQAQANLKTLADQFTKRKASYDADPQSISSDALDSAKNAMNQAEAGALLAQRQLGLTQAGTWSYDLQAQERQVAQAVHALQAAQALLDKYTIKARVAGQVLSVNAAVGSYASPQGAYNPYTQGTDPLMIMSTHADTLSVRCYVDEILVSKLPGAQHIQAQMTVRGSNQKVNLTFDRIQPLVIPKIQLADQRQEKVDLRVLPVLFRFARKDVPAVYPGQLVDVYIGQK